MELESVEQHKSALLLSMPELANYSSSFRSINKRWDGAITAGMIETGRMADDTSRLFGPLIQDMGSTKSRYSEIQNRLVDAILFEMAKKVVFEIKDAAKFVINILKRNLFERTADVGYLATDDEIVNLLRLARDSDDMHALEQESERIRQRLAEYQYEYTVYDEILVLDTEGYVRANLSPDNPLRRSTDPCLQQAQAVNLHSSQDADKYVELYRKTDLHPRQGKTLVYAQKIEDPETHRSLGTLCLCFNFEQEVEDIFRELGQGNQTMTLAFLDTDGSVMDSNDPAMLPVGSKVETDAHADFRILTVKNRKYLVNTTLTDGYQGFYGLQWYGLAMVEVGTAFAQKGEEGALDDELLQKLQSFSRELMSIKDESDGLLADMKLDSINGQVKAAKYEADGFVEVLRFVDWIGDEIDGLLSQAISNLQRTVISSLFNDLQFRAYKGNNIADRNLYERANDVCWWALTPLFRRLLAKNEHQGLDADECSDLKDSLQYINDLYTPYLRLVLTDTKGVVVAVSDPPAELEETFVTEDMPRGQQLVGMKLDHSLVHKALTLPSSKDYCVSPFSATPLYGGRPTYIYSTAVRSPDNSKEVVGTIQVVFDASPQFTDMLLAILPRDAKKEILQGSFALFAERGKKVIAASAGEFAPGESLPLPDALFRGANGERFSSVVELQGRHYTVGQQISAGYREYKCSDGYANDVVCLVFIPMA